MPIMLNSYEEFKIQHRTNNFTKAVHAAFDDFKKISQLVFDN